MPHPDNVGDDWVHAAGIALGITGPKLWAEQFEATVHAAQEHQRRLTARKLRRLIDDGCDNVHDGAELERRLRELVLELEG